MKIQCSTLCHSFSFSLSFIYSEFLLITVFPQTSGTPTKKVKYYLQIQTALVHYPTSFPFQLAAFTFILPFEAFTMFIYLFILMQELDMLKLHRIKSIISFKKINVCLHYPPFFQLLSTLMLLH
ncbi:hypothetical protein ACOSP7_004369 [Xanthoceras sorbifolium]